MIEKTKQDILDLNSFIHYQEEKELSNFHSELYDTDKKPTKKKPSRFRRTADVIDKKFQVLIIQYNNNKKIYNICSVK